MLLGGPEGTGKSSFYNDIIGRGVGDDLLIVIQRQESATGQFNYLDGKKLVIFDDIPKPKNGKDAQVNETKNLQTAKKIRSEKKHHNEKYIKNMVQTINLSNDYKKMIPIGSATEAARRYWGVLSLLTPWISTPYITDVLGFKTKEEYWDWYFAEIKKNDYEAVKTFFNFLYHAPIEKFDPRHPTQSRLVLENKISTMSEVTQWWVALLKKRSNNGDGTWTTAKLTKESGVEEEEGSCSVDVLWYNFFNGAAQTKVKKPEWEAEFRTLLPPSVRRVETPDFQPDPTNTSKRKKCMKVSYEFRTWMDCVEHLNKQIPGIKGFIVTEHWESTESLRTEYLKSLTNEEIHNDFVPLNWVKTFNVQAEEVPTMTVAEAVEAKQREEIEAQYRAMQDSPETIRLNRINAGLATPPPTPLAHGPYSPIYY